MPNLAVLSVRAAVLALAAAVALVPTGCNSDPGVNSYTVPKDAAPAEGGYRLLGLMVPADNPQWFFKYTGTTDVLAKHEADFDKLAASVAVVNGEPQFAPPEGWERGPGRESQFVKVFATVNTKDKSQEISITQSGGGVPTNLKRWVGQIGLMPGPDMLLKYTKLIDTKGGKALRIALQGPKNPVTDRGGMPGGPGGMPKDDIHGGLTPGGPAGGANALTTGEYRILGAMFPAEEPQWFVKLPGTAAGLEPHAAAFDKLLASFALPPGAAPTFEAPFAFETGLELGRHFARDARHHTLAEVVEEPRDRGVVALREFAQRPRQRLLDHLVLIVDQPLAHHERPRRVARASARLEVERHGRDERDAAPPAIG
jgi:hypothetical protein